MNKKYYLLVASSAIIIIVFILIFGIHTQILPSYASKQVAVLNWSFSPIYVEQNTEEDVVTVSPFGTYQNETSARNLYISTDINQPVSMKSSVPLRNDISIITHAEEEICYFQKDVSELYYQIPFSYTQKPTLLLQSSQNIVHVTENQDLTYVYPGKTHISQLPSYPQTFEPVIGIYPIPCMQKDNESLRNAIANLFLHYNPQEQNRLLESELQRIQEIVL